MGRKLKFILSDLHLGAGRGGEFGNLLEDFTATEALIAFLQMIWQESHHDQREIELIINGDFLEFLQVPAVDHYDPATVYPKTAYLDSSEKASVKRLNIIVDGHPEIFEALSDFIHIGVPRRYITLIKGNHDVNLFWPGVKSRLREVLGASGARASLLRFANEFVSREKIYVEHGHQRAEKINSYRDSFNPLAINDMTQLQLPIGSQFMIHFLNEVEPDWWFIDKIKPVTTIIWYALEWNFDLASQALISFIHHTATLTDELAGSIRDLRQALEDTGKRRELAQQYQQDPTFRRQFHGQILQLIETSRASSSQTAGSALPQVSQSALEMGQANQKRQRALLRRAAEEISAQEKATVVLFGHTHEAIRETLNNGSLYINTGSWIKDLSEASAETWAALFRHEDQPEPREPAGLPYARIDYDQDNNPKATLLDFSQVGSNVEPAALDNQNEGQAAGFLERKFAWLRQLLKPTR